MKVLIICNRDFSKVIYRLPQQTKEIYSSKTIEKIANSLEKRGHYVEIADGNIEIIDRLKDFFSKGRGIVFNLSYGIQGDSRYVHIPSILEMLGIPYTGSSPEGHTLALDKVITKIILEHYGIQTPEFWVFSSPDEDMSNVKFPAIAKPRMGALSLGIQLVNDTCELKKVVEKILEEFHQDVIVEEFIKGREFSVGLLGNVNDLETFPVLEFDFGGDINAMQSTYLKKYKPVKKICPASISEEVAIRMREMSKKVFHILGLKDYARTDIRMDLGENIHLLEVNSQASLGETGSFIHAAKVTGRSFEEIINRILDVAIKRYPMLKEN